MIQRQILSELEEHLSKPEITLLVGPRQAGKTYLMQLLKTKLESDGLKTLFLSLDFEQDRQYFGSQADLLKKIQLEFGGIKGYIFIDEIQRKADAGLFLKGLYDQGLSYKFIVSGSGSLELKENIHESLAGRKQVFEITPLTFSEFVNFRTDYKYLDRWNDFFAIEKNKAKELFEEYLMFGGYPKVVLSATLEDKKAAMGELYQSYLERDIKALLGVHRLDAFSNLVKILASQIGGMINVSELANTVGASVQTINNYLWYMEKTFIINRISPYFRNIRKEISKSPLYYFGDLGLRNYSLGLFGVSVTPATTGHLFENFTYLELKENFSEPAQIHYWHTRSDAEVDFVVDRGSQIIPVEVKYRKIENSAISRSFRNFLEVYSPPRGFIIHLGEFSQTKVNKTTVEHVPYHQISFIK
ncbi:ATP-binding protein [Candidatus Amesbacteria bacterium]|nr:ATP-binding protein [Candidatus Amesbacteria bacterium]